MSRTQYNDDGSIVGGSNPGGGTTPVILDLNADGCLDLQPLEFEETQAAPRFDWDGDGVRDRTAWAGASDGFLAIDLATDGGSGPDGSIDQARELMFSIWGQENGGGEGISDLEGLRLAFDTNHDSVLDSNDARWNEFRIWQDANQDGITDLGELRTLSEAGITSIELVPSSVGAVEFPDGSAITGTSSYHTVGGTTGLVGDATLAYEPSGSSLVSLEVNNLIQAMAAFQPVSGAGTADTQAPLNGIQNDHEIRITRPAPMQWAAA